MNEASASIASKEETFFFSDNCGRKAAAVGLGHDNTIKWRGFNSRVCVVFCLINQKPVPIQH